MRAWILIVAVGCLVLAPVAVAQDVAEVWAAPERIEIEPLVEYGRMVLSVSGPEGFQSRTEFEAGELPGFSILDPAGGVLPDGSYSYELRVVPADVRRRDDAEADRVTTKGRRGTEGRVQSGSFAVVRGSIVAGGETEPGGGAGPGNLLAPKDQVIADDLIVQRSLCVGFDCVNGESFGFDTIRLKENNLRIKFQDTSTSSFFPSNDWQLTANDSAAGGQDRFSIEDVTSSRVPFTVEGGASTHSLYVDGTGRIGLGTSTPVLDLHVADGNTPGLRLEQDGSGGFQPQTWDVAGNEVSFFVRDVTGGSRLPFRIRPGAPTSSLDIAATGDVGLGTTSPAARLDVVGSIAVSGTVDGRDVAADGAALDAHVADFDNPHQVTAAQLGIEEDLTKAGILTAASFSGNPPTATVTFADPFPAGTAPVVLLTALTDDAKKTASPTLLAKDESGFTVTLGNGETSQVVEVGWLARPAGE